MTNSQSANVELQEKKMDSTILGTSEIPQEKSLSVQSIDAEAAEGAQTSASPRTVHGISVCFYQPMPPSCSLSSRVLLTSLQWFLMTFSMLSTVFLYALDNTITADLIPVLVSSCWKT